MRRSDVVLARRAAGVRIDRVAARSASARVRSITTSRRPRSARAARILAETAGVRTRDRRSRRQPNSPCRRADGAHGRASIPAATVEPGDRSSGRAPGRRLDGACRDRRRRCGRRCRRLEAVARRMRSTDPSRAARRGDLQVPYLVACSARDDRSPRSPGPPARELRRAGRRQLSPAAEPGAVRQPAFAAGYFGGDCWRPGLPRVRHPA